jgi:hypothetical protein
VDAECILNLKPLPYIKDISFSFKKEIYLSIILNIFSFLFTKENNR